MSRRSDLALYGTMSLAHVLEPAIGIATSGFVVDQVFADQTQQNLDYFNDLAATARLFLDPDGTPRDVGSVFRNPELARTYGVLSQQGPAGFHRTIARRSSMPSAGRSCFRAPTTDGGPG